jgi:RNase P/RNase MRP subunit p29
VMVDGATVEGSLVHATRNTLMVRLVSGGLQQIPVRRLQRLTVTAADGRQIGGPVERCETNRCVIEVGGERLWIQGDRVVMRDSRVALVDPSSASVSARASPPSARVTAMPLGRSKTASPARVVASPLGVMPSSVDPAAVAPAAGPPAQADLVGSSGRESADGPLAAVIGPAAAAEHPDLPETERTPSPDAPTKVTVTTSPSEPSEGAGEIVFTVALSRPHEQSVVVIYATVDAEARAGADYRARRGILTLQPGTTSSEIRTAVIDDDEVEGDEGFHLFLAGDPQVTDIPEPWTKVTIRDNDG